MGYEILFQYTSEADLQSFEKYIKNVYIDKSDKSELVVNEWYILRDIYNETTHKWKFTYELFTDRYGKMMQMKRHIKNFSNK